MNTARRPSDRADVAQLAADVIAGGGRGPSPVPSGPGPAPDRGQGPQQPDSEADDLDLRGQPAPQPEGFCANHPLVRAEAACAECGKALCPECFYASGGGHAFCRECMEASRLVGAEPQILGRVEESVARPSASVAGLAVVLTAWSLALAAAVFVLWALLSRGG